MDTGNDIIQAIQMTVVQINLATIEHIRLTAVKHLDTMQNFGCIHKITEINGITGSGNTRAMLCGAKYFQTSGCCFRGQFSDCAKRMAT